MEKDAQRDSQIEALKRERDGYLKQLTEGDKNLSAQIQVFFFSSENQINLIFHEPRRVPLTPTHRF